jgi:hypothetical protein
MFPSPVFSPHYFRCYIDLNGNPENNGSSSSSATTRFSSSSIAEEAVHLSVTSDLSQFQGTAAGPAQRSSYRKDGQNREELVYIISKALEIIDTDDF